MEESAQSRRLCTAEGIVEPLVEADERRACAPLEEGSALRRPTRCALQQSGLRRNCEVAVHRRVCSSVAHHDIRARFGIVQSKGVSA